MCNKCTNCGCNPKTGLESNDEKDSIVLNGNVVINGTLKASGDLIAYWSTKKAECGWVNSARPIENASINEDIMLCAISPSKKHCWHYGNGEEGHLLNDFLASNPICCFCGHCDNNLHGPYRPLEPGSSTCYCNECHSKEYKSHHST